MTADPTKVFEYPLTMNIGDLKRMLSIYIDSIEVGVCIPGGEVFAITGATMVSKGSHKPLVFQLATERNLESKKVQAVLMPDAVGLSRDALQP